MEPGTVHLLQDLPDELAARGWQLVPGETKVIKHMGAAYHVVVYQRPYHAPVDHLGTALTVRGGYVYVSTREARSTSWEEARAAAIEQMRTIDAPRPM